MFALASTKVPSLIWLEGDPELLVRRASRQHCEHAGTVYVMECTQGKSSRRGGAREVGLVETPELGEWTQSY